MLRNLRSHAAWNAGAVRPLCVLWIGADIDIVFASRFKEPWALTTSGWGPHRSSHISPSLLMSTTPDCDNNRNDSFIQHLCAGHRARHLRKYLIYSSEQSYEIGIC